MGFAIARDDVLNIRFKGRYLEQLVINNLAFSGTEEAAWGVNPTDSTQLGELMRDLWVTQMVPLLSSSAVLESVTVQRVVGYRIMRPYDPVNPALSMALNNQDEFITTDAGALAGDTLPSYVAVTCRKKTLFAGKKWRGSNRIAGLTEAQTAVGASGNFLAAATLAAFEAAWDNVANIAFNTQPYPAPVANPMKAGIISLKQMFLDNPPAAGVGPFIVVVANPGNYFHRVSSAPVNERVGSQVSRKLGHGA